MTQTEPEHPELLPHLFRQEYAKMTAILCRHFGLMHIEIAEDIASDTFLKASENWAIHGIPENPTAWLYTVAKNKVKDYFKHLNIYETRVKNELKQDEHLVQPDIEFNEQNITDSQLAMIFAVCNPVNSDEQQVCLALQILCGFSVEEIANAFLVNRETIKKRLLRARNNLRNDRFQISIPVDGEIKSRLKTVLRTIYLLFNEGYYSKTNDHLIRKELCTESMRLCLLLTEYPISSSGQTNALLALMCFQSSRLEARLDENGAVVLFEDQDRTCWDQSLIDQGNYYLVQATNGSEISKYHLEAGIAYWHTTLSDATKWPHILELYNQLILFEYSPVTALNRAFAFSHVYGNEEAISEVEKLEFTDNSYYHALLGYLYSTANYGKAIDHYQQAIKLSKSRKEKESLTAQIDRLGGAKKP
ncbi:RNA polymerase sigma factor [Mangrovibacterium diazotrophicum]|uniref:RNA polymerase sigma-70 factor (ECF subfamily) n=1 Tax=Mangrovibacterium diazotrophicum TaxID=1261403 RepID=A0A419VW11_9BACT|nr:sigma-70 family RNA polymerase sigma factor [Mangrovibacterium diazotrophicum]RKD86308.1 RNA polymerase sigma-70 factor (ECF subfamily) [Mangrovibacterium diazotrophicum]